MMISRRRSKIGVRMSDIGFYHPLIVHFVIALAIAGVLFRWTSFTGAATFTGPAAAALLLLGTAAGVVAVWSGSDASIDVEGIPGAAALVGEHGEWGLRSRNILLTTDMARTTLLRLRTEFPQSARLHRRLDNTEPNASGHNG
jgi:uncharacterized membrane protein